MLGILNDVKCQYNIRNNFKYRLVNCIIIQYNYYKFSKSGNNFASKVSLIEKQLFQQLFHSSVVKRNF